MIQDSSLYPDGMELTVNDPNAPNSRRWRRFWLYVGGVLVVGVCGGLTYGWFFLQNQLPPIVEQQLGNFLNRRVKIGSVQGLSLTGVRFGKSEILATPTDPAHISLESVDVTFDLFKVLTHSQLVLDVTAIKPDIYFQQGVKGSWLITPFDSVEKAPKFYGISIALETLRLKDADVILVARSFHKTLNNPVKFFIPSGKADFFDKGRIIDFELTGQLAKGGKVKVSGEGKSPTQEINLLVVANQVQGTDLSDLVPLPFKLQQGKVGANLGVKLQLGTGKLPYLQGVGTLDNVTLQVPGLPQAIAHSTGYVRFNGTQIDLEQVSGSFGSINAVADGSLQLGGEYNLTAKTQPFSIQDAFKTLKIKPLSIPMSASLQGNITVKGSMKDPRVSLDLETLAAAKIDKLDFSSVNANLQVTKSQVFINDFKAVSTLGGKVQGKGSINLKDKTRSVILNVKGTGLPTQKIAQVYKTTLPASVGNLSTELTLSGNLTNLKSITATGTASFALGSGNIEVSKLVYINENWYSTVQASGVNIASLGITVPTNIPTGKVNANLNLWGNINSFEPDKIQGNGSASLALAGGKVTFNNLNLAQGKWETNLIAQGLRTNQLRASLLPQLNGLINGNLILSGTLKNQDIQGIGTAQLTLNSGIIQATRINIVNRDWTAKLKTDNLQIAHFVSSAPISLQGRLGANFNLSGNLDSNLSDIQATGNAYLSLPSGIITAENINLNQGKFKTFLTSQQVKLAQFSAKLPGYLGGRLQVTGDLNQLNLSNITAQGKLDFSEGIALIDRPLTTTFNWNGKRLNIQKAIASNFSAKGFIDVNTATIDKPQHILSAINTFDLNVTATRLDLQGLSLISTKLPSMNYGGRLDFNGSIKGELDNPNIEGEIALNGFHVANLNFEPFLSGSVQTSPLNGVNLQLNGIRDNIQVSLNSDYQPLSFDINLDKMSIKGTRQEQTLLATANNIPLEIIKDFATLTKVPIPQAILSQPVAGEVSGNFGVNLDNRNLWGENVAIANPRFGRIQGDRFTGEFSIKGGDFLLTRGQFKRNQSQYNLNASITQSPTGPRLHTEISVAQGQIQDVLETLQIFEIGDLQRGIKTPTYGKASSLWTGGEQKPFLFSVGLEQGSLGEQLDYFGKIEKIFNQTRQQEQKITSVPELRELQGNFDGNLIVNASLKTGIEAQFNFQGQKWQWGKLNINQVQAKGNFKDGYLHFDPVRLQLGNSLLAFSGQLNDKNQGGQLQLRQVPLTLIKQFVTVPPNINLTGLVNADVTIGGNRDNPQLNGTLAVANLTLNQTPIQSTKGEFIYNNSRLTFSVSSLINNHTVPIQLEGSIPYKLPFAKVIPASDQLNLNIRVKDDGLALLNILTSGQVSYVDGQGEVNLDIVGQFDQKQRIPTQLTADGSATISNATIAAQFLPNIPLTQVNGKILFNLNQIQVENLTGNFSGGQVTIAGVLPLIKSTPVNNPLTLKIPDLTLKLKDLYQGDVAGTIQVTGSLFSPKIGGEVNLFKGQVLLSESIQNSEKIKLPSWIQFNNLQLNLKDNLWLSRPPVLNFLARGNLTLNGSLAAPLPDGTIKLRAGQVNLFAAQFGLVGGEANTAQFIPSRGLDPYLDVRLLAVVSETTRNPVRTNPLSSEINDTSTFPADSLQTVRIQAKVQGLASQLTNNLEFTSLPPRSQTEIIGLLGGSFVNNFTQGDTALGLANLAGSAVFGTIQGPISEALGLSDFRIYPTQLINEKERIGNYQLGIAAEASVDVREDLSVSVQKILNTDRPPQMGIRYRINENTVIRGSSNFYDDSRGIIEYERRF